MIKRHAVLATLLACLLAFSGCASRATASSSAAAAGPPAASSAAPTTPDAAAPDAGAPSAAPDTAPGERWSSPSRPPAQSGLLTAGEWNDNDHWEFFQGVLVAGQDWDTYQRNWSLTPTQRLAVRVVSAGQPVPGASVALLDAAGQTIFDAVTDYSGTAYLFSSLFANSQERAPAKVRAELGGATAEAEYPASAMTQELRLELQQAAPPAPALDLMLMFDTTGSMDDELKYLQAELEGVVTRVSEENANLPIRLSVNFYRDEGDQYVVRPFPFTTNIRSAVRDLNKQHASGGGDFPEAVEQALESAVYDHKWEDGSVKLMFLILDAPPHNTSPIVSTMHEMIKLYAAQGIRIIPVASSGINTETEFLLRTLAASTGGTYVFLTDDSGVGESHLEPTIGPHTVERLDTLLTTIINRYLRPVQTL